MEYLTAALQHAGIRDGDGMKKSGSKHHTKAAGLCLQEGAEEAGANLVLSMSHELKDMVLTLNILLTLDVSIDCHIFNCHTI